MDLDEKLRKIEALFSGVKTDGECQAGELVKQRILERFAEELTSHAKEFKLWIPRGLPRGPVLKEA